MVPLNDALGYPKSQPGSSLTLSREKRFEELGAIFRTNAAAGIGNDDTHTTLFRVGPFSRGIKPNPQPSLWWAGFHRVQENVGKHLGQLVLKSHNLTLENEFLQMVHGYVPENWKVQALKFYVIYRNRHLADFVPADYRMEIFVGMVGCPDIHPELGDHYNRLLNYHAAHDVSYLLIDNPLISRAGCTAFGAWGKRTVNGHLLTGRNFDWEAAEVFSRDDLLDAVWDKDFVGGPATVTVHIRRLREKIERDPSRPSHIKVVWGSGYKFEPST